MDREEIQAKIEYLMRSDKTEDWAEACRLEALLNGGPWYDQKGGRDE